MGTEVAICEWRIWRRSDGKQSKRRKTKETAHLPPPLPPSRWIYPVCRRPLPRSIKNERVDSGQRSALKPCNRWVVQTTISIIVNRFCPFRFGCERKQMAAWIENKSKMSNRRKQWPRFNEHKFQLEIMYFAFFPDHLLWLFIGASAGNSIAILRNRIHDEQYFTNEFMCVELCELRNAVVHFLMGKSVCSAFSIGTHTTHIRQVCAWPAIGSPIVPNTNKF